MSTLQNLLQKVEETLSGLVSGAGDQNDPAIRRLKEADEEILAELKQIRIRKAGSSFFTCMSSGMVVLFLGIAAISGWATSAVAFLAAGVAGLAVSAHKLYTDAQRVEELNERHERLLIGMDKRRRKRRRLESSGQAGRLIIELDRLDDRVHGSNAGELKKLIRERVRGLKKKYLLPLLNERERTAAFVLSQDRNGLAEDIETTIERIGKSAADLDVKGGRILEKALQAKQDTLERLDVFEKKIETMDMQLEAVESQLSQIRAVLLGGSADRDELERLFDEMEDGLSLSDGVGLIESMSRD